jgi:hypothetical protein
VGATSAAFMHQPVLHGLAGGLTAGLVPRPPCFLDIQPVGGVDVRLAQPPPLRFLLMFPFSVHDK